MNERELAKKLLSGVVIDSIAEYRQLFTETNISDAKDPYWKVALAFFDKLNDDEKEVFFSVIKQVSIDTVSTIAGAIDGSSNIGLDEDLTLLGSDGKVIGESIQEHFLDLVEENEKNA